MKRHIPVKGRKSLYYSTTVSGEKRYEVRYRDVDGHQHFKVVGPDLKEAIAEQARINVKIGRGVKAHYGSMLFDAVSEEWKAARYSKLAPSTTRTYDKYLSGFLIPKFGTRKIRSISTDEIARFLSELRRADGKQMSGSYAQGIYIVLYLVMEYAANDRRGYIPKNPCDSLEAGERPRPASSDKRALTQEEAQALLLHSAKWFKPILLTALTTGMRAGEILGLRWDDIDFSTDTIHVRYQLQGGVYVQTKGKEERDVPLLPALRKVLYALPSRFGGENLFVQPRASGKVTYSDLQVAFKTACKHAGIALEESSGIKDALKGVSIHACRHTYASALLRDGKDVTWVSSLLGHKSPEITLNTYAHVIQRENRNTEAADRLREALGELG